MFYEISHLNSKWVMFESCPFSKLDQGEHRDDISRMVEQNLILCLTWVAGGLEIDRIDVGRHVTQCSANLNKKNPFGSRIVGQNATV